MTATEVATDRSTLPHERPQWRGLLHSWALPVALVGSIALVAAADRGMARTAAIFFVTPLVLLFGISAAYHRLTTTERWRRFMQRLDHSVIYLVIVGSYAPLCLVVLPPVWGVPVLAVVGTAAVVGIGLKWAGRAKNTAYALYPLMGAGAVVAGPALLTRMSIDQIVLVVAGGLTYGLGVLVLFHRRPDPWPTRFGYHEIWHAATLVAAALHFVAFADLLT